MFGADEIPLVDLPSQHAHLRMELRAAIDAVLARGDFVLGDEVRRFENEFAAFCGVPAAVGCGSGTDALQLAFRALGIGPGDEVIVPAFTFAATALAVSLAGGRPVLVDVDPHTALIDAARVEEALTARTRAIVPVHLYGQCADLDRLAALARRAGVPIVEDAAQAHGARCARGRAGSLGAMGCFSFYPSKNLGACGDGGLVTVQDPELAARLRALRSWGSESRGEHGLIGLNSRLDTLQAAVLRVKLPRLEAWNEARRRLAAAYDAALAALPGVERTRTAPGSARHLYVVRVADREAARRALHAAGLQAAVHYPRALHELSAFRFLGHRPGDFPVAEDWARRCLSLPLYPEMPEQAVARAAAVLARETDARRPAPGGRA